MRTYLGEFEQLLLFAVVHLGDDAYGTKIRSAIEAKAGRTVSPGAIYTALDRLETRGLVSSTLGEPTRSAAANANVTTVSSLPVSNSSAARMSRSCAWLAG